MEIKASDKTPKIYIFLFLEKTLKMSLKTHCEAEILTRINIRQARYHEFTRLITTTILHQEKQKSLKLIENRTQM